MFCPFWWVQILYIFVLELQRPCFEKDLIRPPAASQTEGCKLAPPCDAGWNLILPLLGLVFAV